jgi:hypothetical protein
MRYIRTRDSDYGCIIVDTVKYEEFTGEEYEIPNEEIVKEADTIAELVDEFVFLNENEKPIMTYRKLILDTIEICKTIYGAIWTDKGLIYVAKLNEKGELELL